MFISRHKHQSGAATGYLISVILLSLAVILTISLSIWLYIQYSDQKNNVDSKVATAVAKATKKQAEIDETKFAEREKEPNLEFVGPDDYGRLTFDYPKTWSVYVDQDASNSGDFRAYLNPKVVPSIKTSDQRFALRVLIQDKDVDSVISSYDSLTKKGDLKSSATSTNGVNGTRLDGSFNKNTRGAVVIYKVRDKTVSVFTDADTFKPDFEDIIKTIKFNQ